MTKNIVRHTSAVEAALRHSVSGGPGCTVLLTGLSGSGKSTIGFAVERIVLDLGKASYVLDGDNLRFGLNSDLGFSPADRHENVRRVAEVAKLMSDAGIVTVMPLIAPYEADRALARAIHDDAGIAFVEVFVDTPLDVCEERDPKGLYARARSGEIKGMTGIDAPYERPKNPDLAIDASSTNVDEAARAVVEIVKDRLEGAM